MSEDAKLELAIWESEHPEEAAARRAGLQVLTRKFKALEDFVADPSFKRQQRIENLKARPARCVQCEEPFSAEAIVYRRREYATTITSAVLTYCGEHRCGQPDGYHNQDAPTGRYYPNCCCDDHYWKDPEPCVGCGRPVSHPKNAKWRLVRDWAYQGESMPAVPRVFCGLDCKRSVLTAEARARRRAARADCATCSICKRQFALKCSDSRYCSNRCRQAAYRQRKSTR